MTEALTSAIESETGRLAQITDAAERFHATRKLREELIAVDRRFQEIERAAVVELKEGRPWREVGELLGVSGSRAEQIARDR